MDLKGIPVRRVLAWHAVLAKVAEAKACDMARRDYFEHTTPEGLGINVPIHAAGYALPERRLRDRRANHFESLQAGSASGEDAVQDLIIDEGEPSLGHRNHLLGIGYGNADNTDTGIGFARTSRRTYKTYVCVIIARQS